MTKTNNTESTKAKIEVANELTDVERLNAYLVNHAVEHICAALGWNEEDVNEIIGECKKEDGIYWRFTCPSTKDNTKKPEDVDRLKEWEKLPTNEEWEKSNEGVVRVDRIAGKQWYKRPTELKDARTIRSIIASYENYADALDGAVKATNKKLADAAAILGISVDELLAMRK